MLVPYALSGGSGSHASKMSQLLFFVLPRLTMTRLCYVAFPFLNNTYTNLKLIPHSDFGLVDLKSVSNFSQQSFRMKFHITYFARM